MVWLAEADLITDDLPAGGQRDGIYTPMQFLQGRVGVRLNDGLPLVAIQNRDVYFAEVHGFF